MDPQSYRQVLERYDRAKAFGETRSLPEYATHLNDIYQTDAFGAGMRDGPWTRFSTRVDQTLGDTLGQVTGPIGEAFGGAFGHPEAGKAVGEGLPRALIQSAPLYALGPEAGLPATIVALGGTGALFGAQTYADTGSPGAAALSGVTAAALPGLGRFGGNLGARAFGGSRIAGDLAGKAYNEILPATAVDAFQVQVGRFAGSQLAQVGAQLGSQVAQSHVQGGNEGFGDALTSPEFWLNQIPFTVYDAVHAAKTRMPLAGEVRAQLTSQGKVAEPLYTPPPATDVQQAQLDALLNGFTKVNADPNATGEQRAAALKAVLDNVNAPADATAQAAAVVNASTSETPFMLQGHADKIGNGNYRVRVMGHNDIENGPKIGSTVFVNGVEPDANGVFHVTPSQIKPATFELAEPKPKAGLDPAVNPELPPAQPLSQGGELQTYESPALEGQPVELSSADVDGMRAMGVPEQQIARIGSNLVKNADPVLDFFQGKINVDPQGGVVRLGNTDVGLNGLMNEMRFGKSTQLPTEMVQAMKQVYPEAFNGGNVDVNALVKGLKERPMVEVKKLGEGTNGPARRQLDEMIHGWFDTLPPDVRTKVSNASAFHKSGDIEAFEIRVNAIPEEFRSEARRFATLEKQADSETIVGARYVFVAPKSEKDMPGYTEFLVKVPLEHAKHPTEKGRDVTFDAQGKEIQGAWSPEPKFRGPHFGSEDTNVLSFARGYEDVGPDGKGVFHVIENQSDWAQQIRREKEEDSDVTNRDLSPRDRDTTSHPLLALQETLAYKAVIQHVLERNAQLRAEGKPEIESIALSTGETAMGTEGHDKQNRMQYASFGFDAPGETTAKDAATAKAREMGGKITEDVKGNWTAEWQEDKLPQESGMRLHYDKVGPDILSKLTGDKGTVVDLGVHKMWGSDVEGAHPADVEGSPVFRNPDGTPVTNIKARSYSLAKLQGGLAADSTLSIKEAVMKYEQAQQKEKSAREKTVAVPTKVEEWVTLTGGEDRLAVAVKKEGKIYTKQGAFGHADIDYVSPEEYTQMERDPNYLPTTPELGFVDSNGTFLTREQAYDWAKARNRLPKGEFAYSGKGQFDAHALQEVNTPSKNNIEEHLTNGATPTQAVEAARLQTQTPIVDESVTEQAVQENVMHRTVSESQFGEQNKYGGAILDEVGKRRNFGSQPEALEFLIDYQNSHPEDDSTYHIRNAGRSAVGRERGFYIAPKENVKVAYDTNAEGQGMENVLGTGPKEHSDIESIEQANEGNLGKDVQEQELMATPVENRPDVSRKSVLDLLDVADRNPEAYAEFVDPDIIEDSPKNLVAKARITLQLGTEGLAKVNEALVARGIEQFKSEREMTTQMRELMKGASLFVDRYRNVSLDSMVPGDIGALPPGTLDSIQNLAAHIASQKVLGPIADIIDAVVRSGVLSKDIRLGLPGSTEHDPLGWWMHEGHEDVLPGMINVPHYPADVNDTRWLTNAAHEIIHHTEAGLASRDDPQANAYRGARDTVLESLRKSNVVPQKVRTLVAQLVHEDAYGKLRRDELSPEDFRDRIMTGIGKENKALFSYVYAMLDPKEMSATLFTDPKLIAVADTTPMKQGLVESALTFLSKAFNKLIGNDVRNETALSAMLKAYDNYLTGGIMRKVYNGANFVRDSLVAAGVRPDALASRMQTVDRMFARGTLDASVAGFQREQANSLLPTTTAEGTLNPGLLGSLRAPEASAPYDATMNLLAGELPVHQDLLWRMQQDVKMTSDLIAAVKKGQVPGSIPPNAEVNFALARAKVNSMRKAMAKQSLALARWNKLDQFDPLGWEQSISEGLTGKLRNIEPPDEIPDAAETRKLVGLERLSGGGMNWLQKNFMLTTHLKELVPATRPVISGVNDEAGLAHARAVMLNGAYVYDPKTQNLSDTIKKSNERVANSPTLVEAASDLLRWQNKEGGSQGIDLTPGSFSAKTLSRLNEADRKAVLQLITSVWQRHHVWADAILPPALGAINRDNTGALIAARETGMLPSQARDLASQTYDALAAATSADPGQAQVGSAQLQALATKMQPDTFFAALKHAQALSEKTTAWIKRIRDNPGYTTEQRYNGDRLVMVSPTGDKFMTNGTRESLQKIQSDKAAQGYTFLDYIKEEDRANPSYGMKEDTLKALDALDVQNEQIVAELLKDQPDTAARILPRLQRAGDIRAALAASGPLPIVKRKFVEGREHLNMVDNANQFYTRMNNWVRNRATRARSGLDMMHPSVEGNTEVRNLLDQHVNNFLTPDNPLARKFVESTYFYKLGFDLGNMLLEGTQNLTTGMSGLIAESGSVTDAFGLWGKAVKDIIAHKATGKWSDDETTALINRASDQGHLGRPSWSDIVDPDTASVISSNGGSLFDTVRNKAQAFTARATGYNDTIGLISAYRLGREKGMSTDEAFRFAVDIKQRSLFTGGKQQRPVGLWSIKTKAVPQLLGALQTYSLGWFSQMAENYTKGFGKAPEGLTPTQRTGAKKAFMYSLMAQAALAGALGLPGVGQGLALLGQATDTDPKGWLRQNLSKLFGEDQQSGGILTSLALRGVGSAGLPFDPSSRASVSIPFLGVDAYKGFDVANLGGAVTSTTSDFVKGLLGLMHGDTTATAALLPNVAKRPYQLWQGEGDIRDARGGLRISLSPAEQFAMAAGITPSRVQTERDTTEALKKANTSAQRQQESFVDGLATQMRQGKSSEVQQQIIQYLQTHPNTSAKQLVQSIASRVEAQTVPYDWRRDLNPGVQLAGLTSPRPSTELERRNVKNNVAQSLGFPSSNPAEDYRAALLDHLLDSDPLLSRPAARRAVSGKPPSATPYNWLNN